MKNIGNAVLVFALFCAGALAGTEPEAEAEKVSLDDQLLGLGYGERKKTLRIANFRTQNWRYVNDQALVISTSPRKNFLVTFASRCAETKSARAIGIDANGTTLTRHDKILVRNSAGTRRCQIQGLFKLKKANEAPHDPLDIEVGGSRN